MLKPENGEIILLYSTSRQGNNENREVEERYIYWGGQRREAESKRKLFPHVVLCEPEQ